MSVKRLLVEYMNNFSIEVVRLTGIQNGYIAMQHLTDAEFKAHIFDYEHKETWENQYQKPILIDFYADWCGPCTMLNPILENMEQHYGDQVAFFKVDADQERSLTSAFGVQSLPTLLFIPKDGQPQMAKGVVQPDQLKKAIDSILLTEASTDSNAH